MYAMSSVGYHVLNQTFMEQTEKLKYAYRKEEGEIVVNCGYYPLTLIYNSWVFMAIGYSISLSFNI